MSVGDVYDDITFLLVNFWRREYRCFRMLLWHHGPWGDVKVMQRWPTKLDEIVGEVLLGRRLDPVFIQHGLESRRHVFLVTRRVYVATERIARGRRRRGSEREVV